MAYTRRRTSRRGTRRSKGGKRISMKKIRPSHKRKMITKGVKAMVGTLKGVPKLQKQKLMQNLKQTISQGVNQGVQQSQKQGVGQGVSVY